MGILDNTKFALSVCEMFYQKGLSQKEIAENLRISRSQVCRILASAHDKGLITININYPNSDENIYQNKIIEKYGIPEVYVYDTGNLKGQDSLKTLAELSKELFSVVIKDKERVGVMAGKSLSALADALPRSKNRGLEFVPLCGGTASSGCEWYANSVAQKCSYKTNGKYYILNAPQYCSNVAGKEVLVNEPSIKEILDLGKTCDSALIGIGNIDINSTTMQAGRLLESDINELKRLGAVASICSSYIDAGGKVIECELAERIIGQSINDIKNTRKIGIATGMSKVDAIKAVLKGGYLDVLITSLSTAQELV